LQCWFFERPPPKQPKPRLQAKRTQAMKRTQADANGSKQTHLDASVNNWAQATKRKQGKRTQVQTQQAARCEGHVDASENATGRKV
jgi:hypothetical protein